MSRYGSSSTYNGRSLESMRDELEGLLNRRRSPERYPKVMPSTTFRRGLEDIKRGYGFSESERLANHNKLQAALAKNRELEQLLQANIIEHDRVVKALTAKLESQSGFQSGRLGSAHISLFGLKQEMESRLRALEDEWAHVRSIIFAQEQKYHDPPHSSRFAYSPRDRGFPANYPGYAMPNETSEHSEPVPLEKLLQSLLKEVKEDLNAHIDSRLNNSSAFKLEKDANSIPATPRPDSSTDKVHTSDSSITASLDRVLKSNEELREKMVQLSSTQHSHGEKLEQLFSTQADQHEELSQRINNQSEAIAFNSVTFNDRVAQFDQLVATKLAQMDARLDEHQGQQLQYQQQQEQRQQEQEQEQLYDQQEAHNHKYPPNFDATIATPPLTRDVPNTFTPGSMDEPRPYQQSSMNEGSKFSTSRSGSSLATSTPSVKQNGAFSPEIMNLDDIPNQKSSDAKRIEQFAYELRHGLVGKDKLDRLYNVYYNSPQILRENPELLNQTRRTAASLERELGPKHKPILESIQREL